MEKQINELSIIELKVFLFDIGQEKQYILQKEKILVEALNARTQEAQIKPEVTPKKTGKK